MACHYLGFLRSRPLDKDESEGSYLGGKPMTQLRETQGSETGKGQRSTRAIKTGDNQDNWSLIPLGAGGYTKHWGGQV